MSDTKVARVGRRIAPGQMFITLMVAVALAAVLVSSAAGAPACRNAPSSSTWRPPRPTGSSTYR